MNLHLSEIPPEGLTIEGHISNEFIRGREDASLRFVAPLYVKVRAEKTTDSLLAEVFVSGRYSSECNRCLAQIDEEHILDFTLDFPITKGTEYIDIDEDVRQEVILGLPNKVLCSDGCKGICPKCGVNLNKEECNCEK